MLGILNDARVTNTVTMTAAEFGDWTKWRKKFFATLPLGYRAGSFIFPMATVDAYLETMADSNNTPIFRQATGLDVNDGDASAPNGRFFGRAIDIVEPDIIADFDSETCACVCEPPTGNTSLMQEADERAASAIKIYLMYLFIACTD